MSDAVATLRDRLRSGPPLVAVPFTDAVRDDEITGLGHAGLDVAELRIDLFSTGSADETLAAAARMAAVARAAGVLTLATVRSAAEGGSWTGTDDERTALYAQLVPLVDAVDVERSSTAIVDEVVGAAHDAGRVVVISMHDFERTPDVEDLRAFAADARAAGAGLVKVATLADAADDLAALASFVLAEGAEAGADDAPLAVVGMGAFGPASRVVLPLLGSRLTFASHGDAVASGQMTYADTRAMLTRLLAP